MSVRDRIIGAVVLVLLVVGAFAAGYLSAPRTNNSSSTPSGTLAVPIPPPGYTYRIPTSLLPAPTATVTTTAPPSISYTKAHLGASVIGDCSTRLSPSTTGMIVSVYNGSHNGKFTLKVYKPDGTLYKNNVASSYTFDARGAWSTTWTCDNANGTSDPPGSYKLVFHDTTTGENVTTTMVVG
ncbi:MAG TPA: hypothetical protein VLF91_02555 [Candidatus Saccharimonadales bacterium]|nr:hypothetical protein [Candidatus Saccharimonadales bacterium]